MKRIIIIAAMALMSVSAFAQQFAYVDFNELVMLMPEMDEARAAIEENSKINEGAYMDMVNEYQTKLQQYEEKSATWTQSVLEAKQRELMQIEQSIQQAQQDFSKEIQELQQRLQTPIIEEATQVVNDLAKAKGVAVVFEKSSFLYVDPEQVVDLTPEARIILEIPEGRTLETLQAELMAKAQAAQQ